MQWGMIPRFHPAVSETPWAQSRRTTMFAMSGLAPIAAVMLQCHDRSKSATTAVSNHMRKLDLLDHLVGAGEQRRRHGEAQHPGSRMVDHQLEPARLYHGQVRGLGALEDAAGVGADLAIAIRQVRSVA